jgi:hypothetical protein
MKTPKFVFALLILAKLFLAATIVLYFWNVNTLVEITKLPLYVLILTVLYIGFQMVTRRFSKKQNWWDWIYYIGLAAIILPVVMAKPENEKIVHLLTDFGILFLLLPVLIDGYYFVKNQKETI